MGGVINLQKEPSDKKAKKINEKTKNVYWIFPLKNFCIWNEQFEKCIRSVVKTFEQLKILTPNEKFWAILKQPNKPFGLKKLTTGSLRVPLFLPWVPFGSALDIFTF